MESFFVFIFLLVIVVGSHKLIYFEKKYRRNNKIKNGYEFPDMTEEEIKVFNEYKEIRETKKLELREFQKNK